jgi:2-oxoisovalerate dehydrogenase E1 component
MARWFRGHCRRQKLEREHQISVELIDLHASPFDWTQSPPQSGKPIARSSPTKIPQLGPKSPPIADRLFHHLDAPVKRIAATDTFVAYQPILEDAILPQVSALFRAMKELAEF